MQYNGTVYRPPVEANTFLLPVTEGCTHNSCTFCNMYQDIPFRMLSLPELEEYLQEVKGIYGSACEKIRHCDLLMLGTAGKGRGLECARATAKLENEIKPDKIPINTMFAFVGTRLDEDIRNGSFVPASEKENLEEEREFLRGLELPDCYFWALHPLDSVKLDGVLGDSKQRMLDTLEWSIHHVDEGRINRTSRTGTL